MQPVETREVFTEDPNLAVTEQEDGSAVVDLPTEKVAESNHYENLAETLDVFTLNTTATELLELIERDKESRKKRDEQYEEGLRRTGLGDDAPGGADFEGASKVVHPILAEGCVDFAARAIKELFPANGPVKTRTIGEADAPKLDKAKRKRDFLNLVMTRRIPGYRDELEILLTQLPLGGSQYQKFWPDRQKNCLRMEFVPVDKVFLPFSAASFYTSPRITHEQNITKTEFEGRVASGFYRKIDIVSDTAPEESAAEKANDKIQGVETSDYNEDGLRTVYEVSIGWEIKGELAPYIIHVDEPTGKIVAWYRNWEENDPDQEQESWWVEDKFIPWRGVYGIGLPHLIGGLASALTGALRALLDSAHINNSPGAVKLKGGRASGQNTTIAQTEVKELDAPAGVDDIRKIIMPMPFNPPSVVLFQLLDWITAQAKGVVATAEEKIADASNQMPVGTALALIEQGSQVFSSIHARLHESQRRCIEIICRLVRQYPDMFTEDLATFKLTPEDFSETDDVEPVSDPRIFSEAQRYAQLQEQLKVMQLFPQLPWNFMEIARRALELLRVDGIDSMLPKPPEPVTADPIAENVAAMHGAPLKVGPTQDHLAHIMTHLGFIVNPIHQLNPMPAPQLSAILTHASDHLLVFYEAAARASLMDVLQASGGNASEDQLMMEAAKASQLKTAQLIGPIAPMFQQAVQIAQSKAPPPPMDPAIKATFDAAMAEVNRKKEEAQARLQFDAQKLQGEGQLAQAELQMTAQLEAFKEENKKQIAMMQEMMAKQAEEIRQRVELMKNDADNQQHQMTELLKNRDDNQTNIIIAQINKALEAQKPAEQPRQDDGVLKEMQRMLGEIEKAKTGDALTATVDALRQMMEGQRDHQTRTMQMAERLMNKTD